MTTRRFGGTALVFALGSGLVVLGVGEGRARAYEFAIQLQTIGQGYQVRGFAPTGANQLLTRRRLTEVLNLSLYDIEPERWHGDDQDHTARNTIYFDASLRFDTDFGGYVTGRPTGADELRELQQSQIDIFYAFLGGRRLGGRVDFQLGRQIHYDLLDFYAFDGLDALVRIQRYVAAEAFGGTEVLGALPLSSPIYELDGTSVGSRGPTTRHEQTEQMRPLVGAAMVLGGVPGDVPAPVTARLAYRRVWSATADRQPGEPESGVNDEKVALTATAEWRRRVFLTGGVRYNLLLATFDDQQVGLRVRASGRQWVGFEMAYLAPTWDGDSIWNVFAAGAYRDFRGNYELQVIDGLKLYLRAFARHFEAVPDVPGDEARWAAGGSTGAVWRGRLGMLRLDTYFDGGFGGRKVGVDSSGRWQVRPRALELEGRLTAYEWKSDQQPATDTGFVFGAQAGARYRLGEGVRLHALLEDNVGTFYTGQYRGLIVVELDASL